MTDCDTIDVGSPESTLATGDPGDDTARRFRYQYTYAAILGCSLMDDTSGVTEIFCEHHEDVLIKHSDGLFTGCQIKTRESANTTPWKATDESIVTSCVRFARLEKQFSGHFCSFIIVTNHPFLRGTLTKACFPHLLTLRRQCSTLSSADRKLQQFVSAIAEQADCDPEYVFAALGKTTIDDSVPKLNDIFLNLVGTLCTTWPGAEHCSMEKLKEGASILVYEIFKASSLDHLNVLPIYLASTDPEGGRERRAVIDGKRIDKGRLETLLANAVTRPELLIGPEASVPIPDDGSSSSLLQQKLEAGGFSSTSVCSAEDLRSKAQYLALAWIERHGKSKGLKRYDHLRSLILADCATAFERSRCSGDNFGPQMLRELRTQIQTRRQAQEELFECRDEHLVGIAYTLTGECRVKWSLASPWERS